MSARPASGLMHRSKLESIRYLVGWASNDESERLSGLEVRPRATKLRRCQTVLSEGYKTVTPCRSYLIESASARVPRIERHHPAECCRWNCFSCIARIGRSSQV